MCLTLHPVISKGVKSLGTVLASILLMQEAIALLHRVPCGPLAVIPQFD